MAEVVGVVGVGADLRRKELGGVWSIFRAGIAGEPGEVGEGEGLGVWIGGVGYLWRFLRNSRRCSRGFGGCDVMCLRLGGVGLLEFEDLLLDLLQLVLQLL